MKYRLNPWIKKLFVKIIFIISLCLFCYSVYKITVYDVDQKNTEKMIKKIDSKVTIEETSTDENVEIIEQNAIPASNPYWDYIKMNLINVNFTNLKQINNDVKGWIQVNGTNINYPFVQTNDNSFYLNHSFDKNDNIGGWVFLDYKNDITNYSDKNTVIYAHGMKNNTMFGTLKNTLTNGWLDDVNNHIIKLSTEYENTLWEVFSIYKIKTTDDYIITNFNNNDDYQDFINLISSRSSYAFDTSVNTKDRIITLSTCYDDNYKVVLHAKLIKREKRT